MSSLSPSMTSMGNAQSMMLEVLSARSLPFRVFNAPTPANTVPMSAAMPDGPVGLPVPMRRSCGRLPAPMATPAIERQARARAAATPRIERRPARSFLRRCIDTLLLWQRRSETRRALLEMSDHVLKDIGISRSDVVREAMKPFWRA